ncbi:phage holin family protein [Methylobacterium iners]|uniref:Phage holin family protein n=1 Tax=Methylobacterium iners TaxID=418707 RepID=A0ABQ4S3Y4_9HYPH|nr:phage holin family protein [Methylobacterium iners]GJD96872.1 hypothetical protein OCOJLMKI_4099 [Methylobacterium iners]
MRIDSTDGTLRLLATALRQASEHLVKTLTLVHIEVDGNIRALMGLLALLATCVLLLLAALFLFLGAIVKALAALIGSEAWAALIVAAPFVLAAAVLMHLAVRRMRPIAR